MRYWSDFFFDFFGGGGGEVLSNYPTQVQACMEWKQFSTLLLSTERFSVVLRAITCPRVRGKPSRRTVFFSWDDVVETLLDDRLLKTES